ncbi:hypothetical protein SAMN04488117_102340 [Celeribacter baekdonensis]|uniref:Response regulatory domain-containing protein n=2 Tax=Celeribacter baekdonensis TaxID=875171 RepID=A0A1G7IIL0_9RHOB|nr:hypothetical protein SAMN04488117_102340 [Celeribacter baekdonensis]
MVAHMRVLVWHGNIETTARWQVAFGQNGHTVRRARSSETAMDYLRAEPFDMLIFDLVVGRESGLAVALMAEFHQPNMCSILIAGHQEGTHKDIEIESGLFARLASLRCVLGVETPVRDLVTIAEEILRKPQDRCDLLRQSVPQICASCEVSAGCLARSETSVSQMAAPAVPMVAPLRRRRQQQAQSMLSEPMS